MRIAQLAPLAESVPPKLYGGTERVVAWLVNELVDLGHHVTLFASGDSKTRADLHGHHHQPLTIGIDIGKEVFSPDHIEGLFRAVAGIDDVDKITAIALRYAADRTTASCE